MAKFNKKKNPLSKYVKVFMSEEEFETVLDFGHVFKMSRSQVVRRFFVREMNREENIEKKEQQHEINKVENTRKWLHSK